MPIENLKFIPLHIATHQLLHYIVSLSPYTYNLVCIRKHMKGNMDPALQERFLQRCWHTSPLKDSTQSFQYSQKTQQECQCS